MRVVPTEEYADRAKANAGFGSFDGIERIASRLESAVLCRPTYTKPSRSCI